MSIVLSIVWSLILTLEGFYGITILIELTKKNQSVFYFLQLNQQYKEYHMDVQTLPQFSDFQKLRLTNPVQYYRADTQQKMLDAQLFYGSNSYYDLMENSGGFLSVDEE